MVDAAEVFNPLDFQTIQINIVFKNLTTNWEPDEGFNASLVELGDKQLVLELPEKSCNLKHSVMIGVQLKKPGSAKFTETFNATGKIIELEQGEGTIKATLSLIQFDEQSWNEFLNIYSTRQEEINKFLQAVRS